MRALASVLFVSVVSVACGGAVAPIGGESSGSSSSGSGGVGTGTSSSSSSSGASGDPGQNKPPPPGCASPPDPGASDPCLPIAGSYHAHYVKDPSSDSSCTDIPDDDTTVDPRDVNAPSPGCTNNEDKNACVFSTHCDETQGSTTTSTTDVSVSTCGGISGTIELRTSGGFSQHCVYTFVMTKK